MAKILSSKAFIESKKSELKLRCEEIKRHNVNPKLSVVLVGQNPASLSYVKNKKKFCMEIGADCQIIELDQNIEAAKFSQYIDQLNQDDSIHGIIIQLPLPWQLQSLDIPRLVKPNKDVDGFHPENTLGIYYNKNTYFLPCTPSGIIAFITEYLKIDLQNKLVCLIGRSNIVGKPLLHLLNHLNATVIWAHSKTQNLTELTQKSDIIISATGARRFLKDNYFSKNKEQLVIDVGISGGAGIELAGDLDTAAVKDFANLSYTPVPGGVGPLTVFKLIENLIVACEARIKKM
jgi:methylenetetrahydrofolate dehydrogenase (NADP+)/methenyltetrahydrofolate cyclohydrolase